MGSKSSKKKRASKAKAAEGKIKAALSSSQPDAATNDKVDNQDTVKRPVPIKITLRQDSVAYNKTAIQKRKDAEKNPGKMREGTSTADLLDTINSKKSLHCKVKFVIYFVIICR